MIATNLSVLFSNLVGLFLLIGVGVLAVRLRLLPADASKPLSALLMKITLPATVFASMIRPFNPEFLSSGAAALLISALLFPLYALLSLPLSRLFQVPDGRRGMWCCCTTFCNHGFMGFPIVYALFGDDGLILAVLMGIPFNLLVYSLGAKMVCMDVPEGSAHAPLSLRTALISPINVAIVLSLIFYFGQIPVPTPILTPIQHLSNVTTPLSMFVTGMNLAQGKVSDTIRDKDSLSACVVRLLLFPVITWAITLPFPSLNPLVVGVTLIIMAMPAPAVSTIMAEQYGGCTQVGARIVFLSSLLCIVTIPLVSLLL
ncbi:AEC family transporter [Lawsonibacter sp. LCP25S3_G6]|uniref:AEC family transporter n=1 Tax=unclassified Lawsonibacter TaxID=2617946 RepID=UPI003F9993B9